MYTKDEDLFTMNTSSLNKIKLYINNIDLKFWHTRLR